MPSSLRAMKVSAPALAVLAAATTLAGCSTRAPESATPVTALPPAPPSASPDHAAATFAPRECSTPQDSLVRRVLDVAAVGSGDVTRSTLVPAVTTATGDWYVVGVDQDVTIGDGTRFPDKSSRSLAVTDADPRHATVIRLTSGLNFTGDGSTWRRVSWTGRTLALGKQAVAKAVACLDAQG